MKCPCKICISQSCCTQLCINEREYRHYLDTNINSTKKYIFSINGHRRKRLSNVKLLHYNSFINKWNKHAKIALRIIYRNPMEGQ